MDGPSASCVSCAPFVYRNRVDSWIGRLFSTLVLLGIVAAAGFYLYMNNDLRSSLLRKGSKAVGTRVEDVLFFPTFDPRDKHSDREDIALVPVARGLQQPTDIAFLPPPLDAMVVLEQVGRVTRVNMKTGAGARWLDLETQHGAPEQGLLGVAIHPNFLENGRMFFNYTADEGGKTFSFVSEYLVPDPKHALEETPSFVKHIMKVEQPYSNHNGGCTRFGPDGMLYIGWGDGGAGGDPEGHGQNGKDLLGSIVRIDVNSEDAPLAYHIPADNPFLNREDVAPETYVIGVRNPWRFSWDLDGRLVVADVGQNDWEEVGLALPGENLGWNTVEGKTCFGGPHCETKGLRQPFWVYGRDQGVSVTGGEVLLAEAPAALAGSYIFGDYSSGRLWALEVPESPNADATSPIYLGAWPLHPSTFGRDHVGQVYVADHQRGIVYRFAEKPPSVVP